MTPWRRREPRSTRSCAVPEFLSKPPPKTGCRFSPRALAPGGSTRYRTAGPLLIPAVRAIMAKIHFVDHTGETRIIDVENGATVMEAAIRNAIPGIEAECGGACACATCHVS